MSLQDRCNLLEPNSTDGNDRRWRCIDDLTQSRQSQWVLADMAGRFEDVPRNKPVGIGDCSGLTLRMHADTDCERRRETPDLIGSQPPAPELDPVGAGRQGHVDPLIDYQQGSGLARGRDESLRQRHILAAGKGSGP